MKVIINNKNYNIIVMNTFFKRLKGLMFKKDTITNIYLFKRCRSIHTFFMKQNIDVCMLDKDYNIIYLKKDIKPFSIIIGKGYYTLEMPLNTVKYLKLNTKLKIKE